MGPTVRCHILALVGWGETSPTMVSIHRDLVARMGTARPSAVLLDTPYGFQENAADISARAQAYFRRGVGLHVDIAPGLRTPDDSAHESIAGLAAVRPADWVFSGPGSPSYALRLWRDRPIGRALSDRVGAGPGRSTYYGAGVANAPVSSG